MITPEEPGKEKKGLLDRLPKLGRISQLALIIGIFIILFVPLFFINQQQEKKQVELQVTLDSLQKALETGATPVSRLEAEREQVKAEIESAKAVYPSSNLAPEIMDSFVELAELNDIYITSARMSPSQSAKGVGPLLTFELGFEGQVPKFQNFLLALGDRFPTSQIKLVNFTTADEEGEYDTCNLSIEVQCYDGQ